MAFQVPTVTDLARRAWTALRGELPGTDALLPDNNLHVTGKVWGLLLHEAHLRMGWVYRQIFAATAEAAQLDRHGAEYGIARRGAARAAGTITAAGLAGTVYPAGIRWLAGTTVFETTAAATAAGGGAVTMLVRAVAPGAAGNLPEGAALTLADPGSFLTLVPEAVVAAGAIGGGADTEGDEDYRARILDRKRRPPQGGAVSDYEQWARAVPGVVAAWAAQPVNGPGSVVVWILFEGRENLIPEAGDLAVVQAALDARRRVTTHVYVVAPVPVEIDVTVTGLSPDTTAVREAIGVQLAALFRPDAPIAARGRARPGLPTEDTVFSRSWVAEAVSLALGERRHVLTTPAADVELSGGEYPVLGDVEFG